MPVITEIDAVLTVIAKHKEIMHDTMQKICKELYFIFRCSSLHFLILFFFHAILTLFRN